MSQNIYQARNSTVGPRELDHERMIMTGRDSTLFTLGEVAAIIWESANGLVTLDETVELKIYAEFDVETAAAQLDAEMMAETLAQDGILHRSRQPMLDSNAPLESSR